MENTKTKLCYIFLLKSTVRLSIYTYIIFIKIVDIIRLKPISKWYFLNTIVSIINVTIVFEHNILRIILNIRNFIQWWAYNIIAFI